MHIIEHDSDQIMSQERAANWVILLMIHLK